MTSRFFPKIHNTSVTTVRSNSQSGFFTLAAVFLLLALAILMLGTIQRYRLRQAKTSLNEQADLAALATAESIAGAGNAQALVNNLQLALYGLDMILGVGHATAAAAAILDRKPVLAGTLLIQGFVLLRDLQKVNRALAQGGDLLGTLVPQAFTIGMLPVGVLPFPLQPETPQWIHDDETYSSGFCGSLGDGQEPSVSLQKKLALQTGRESPLATLAILASDSTEKALDRSFSAARDAARTAVDPLIQPLVQAVNRFDEQLSKGLNDSVHFPQVVIAVIRNKLTAQARNWPPADRLSALVGSVREIISSAAMQLRVPPVPASLSAMQAKANQLQTLTTDSGATLPPAVTQLYASLGNIVTELVPDLEIWQEIVAGAGDALEAVLRQGDRSRSLSVQLVHSFDRYVEQQERELQQIWRDQLARLRLQVMEALSVLEYSLVDQPIKAARKQADSLMTRTLRVVCRLGRLHLLDTDKFPMPMPTLRAAGFADRSRISMIQPGGKLGLLTVAESTVTSPTSGRMHLRPDLQGTLSQSTQMTQLLKLDTLPPLLRGILWPR